jgi:hypothetical protein
VCRKPGIDALALGEHAERVPAAVAVARRGDLVDPRRAQVGHGRGEDGVRRVGPVLERELGRVEARRVKVQRRRLAVEHVRRDDEEARAGERVGEAGVGWGWLVTLVRFEYHEKGGVSVFGNLQLVLRELDPKDIRQIQDAHFGLLAARLGDVQADCQSVSVRFSWLPTTRKA